MSEEKNWWELVNSFRDCLGVLSCTFNELDNNQNLQDNCNRLKMLSDIIDNEVSLDIDEVNMRKNIWRQLYRQLQYIYRNRNDTILQKIDEKYNLNSTNSKVYLK